MRLVTRGSHPRMIAPRKQSSGFPILFGAVAVLVVVVGYWYGPVREKALSRKVFVPERRERKVPANIESLAPSALARHFPGGAVDEVRQWKNVRNLSLEEVKAVVVQLQKGGGDELDSLLLEVMLFYRWGELDPAAANAKAKALFMADPPPKGLIASKFPLFRQAAITAWIKQGGAAEAWEAVKDEQEFWACTHSVSDEVAEMIVASLADRSDKAAFREVMRLDDDNCVIADNLCRARARKAFETPESRAAFLSAAALHPEPYVLGCAYQFLFREWAHSDLAAARAGAAAMERTEEMRKVAEREIESAARDKEGDSEKAVDVLAEDSNMEEAGAWRETKKRVLERWEASPCAMVDYRLRDETFDLLESTPQADLDAWFRELTPVPNVDEDKDAPLNLRELIHRFLVQCGPDRFVRSLANHPPIHMDDALDETMHLWTEHDPASVKVWLERDDLPPSVIGKRDEYLEDALDALDQEDDPTATE